MPKRKSDMHTSSTFSHCKATNHNSVRTKDGNLRLLLLQIDSNLHASAQHSEKTLVPKQHIKFLFLLLVSDVARRLKIAGAVGRPGRLQRHHGGAGDAAALATPPRRDAAEDGPLPHGGGAHQWRLLDGWPRAGMRLRPAGRARPTGRRLRTRPRLESQV